MLNLAVLDVVIGLVFIFLLYSLLATALREAIATIFSQRAGMLYEGIKSMLTDTPDKTQPKIVVALAHFQKMVAGFVYDSLRLFGHAKDGIKLHDQFYNQPVIKNYGQNWLWAMPSYLSNKDFSETLIQTLCSLDSKDCGEPGLVKITDIERVLEAAKDKDSVIGKSIDAETRKILQGHLNASGGDIEVFKARLDKWYDDTMERVSGWYKRNTQFWLFGIGLTLAVLLNIDTIEIAGYLSKDEKARDRLVSMAESYVETHPGGVADSIAKEVFDSLKVQLNEVNTLVGMGWDGYGLNDQVYFKELLKCSDYEEFENWLTEARDQTKIEEDTFAKLKLAALDSNIIDQRELYKDARFVRTWQSRILLDSVVLALEAQRKNGADEIIAKKDKARKDKEDKVRQMVMNNILSKYPNQAKIDYVIFKIRSQKKKMLGLFISAIAIGLGAPFWFDLLNKLVNLRSAVKTKKAPASGDVSATQVQQGAGGNVVNAGAGTLPVDAYTGTQQQTVANTKTKPPAFGAVDEDKKEL